MSKAFFHKMPTVLCKIVGVYQIGFQNKVTGKRQMDQVCVCVCLCDKSYATLSNTGKEEKEPSLCKSHIPHSRSLCTDREMIEKKNEEREGTMHGTNTSFISFCLFLPSTLRSCKSWCERITHLVRILHLSMVVKLKVAFFTRVPSPPLFFFFC